VQNIQKTGFFSVFADGRIKPWALGLILPTKILCSEKFSVKIRKLRLHQIFHKSLKNFLGSVLTRLNNYLNENVLYNSSM
jgi:hypothetical protein